MTTEPSNPDTLGRRLFSFGVITDTHVNQGEDDCNFPFEVNRLADRPMRHVVHDLNARDLAFVVNVPLRSATFRRELMEYANWFNQDRPHSALDGRMPHEVHHKMSPACNRPRFEPRAR